MNHDFSIIDACMLPNNEQACDLYLAGLQFSAIPRCNQCEKQMTARKDRPNSFRCHSCNTSKASYADTIFKGCKISKGHVLLLGYLFVCEIPLIKVSQMTGHCPKTVRYWHNLFRQAITFNLEATNDENKIGGDGVVIEIDESKFGKRKYNRGHRVEGVWVVGGRERTQEKRMFAVKVDDRSAETLLALIQRHVHPGSIIITDCWKGYKSDGLIELGMLHTTVNHSLHFVDPTTGAHTNGIEGTWSAMKVSIPKRKRTENDIEPCLFEYVWRRNNQGNLWASFIIAIKDIYNNLELLDDEIYKICN